MDTKVIDVEYTITQLAELMIRDHGIHEGLFDIAVKFQLAVGAIGPSPESILPGAMIGIDGVGLKKVDQIGPLTVDAAKVNPKQTAKKKATTK